MTLPLGWGSPKPRDARSTRRMDSAEHVTIFEPLANAVNWVGIAGLRQADAVGPQGPDPARARNGASLPSQDCVVGSAQPS
jgi:hypothetical protein